MVLINILLVDDHVLFAKSLSIALEEYSEVGELITTQSIENLESIVSENDIDIVLMDINLGNLSDTDGLEAAAHLLKTKPDIKIMILTGYDLPVYRHEARKIGVCGFLNKNIGPDVSHGKTCFPAETDEIIIEDLTSMEKKILQLISTGKKRKDIADALYMSERTLSNHLQHIFEKLAVSSTVEAVTKALQFGYIPPI